MKIKFWQRKKQEGGRSNRANQRVIPDKTFYRPRRTETPTEARFSGMLKQRSSSRFKLTRPKLSVGRPEFDFSLKRAGAFLVFVVVVSILSFAYGLHSNQVFIVKEVNISGNQEISNLQITGVVGDLRGQSMLTIYGGDIEAELEEGFIYIKSAEVTKVLPGVINIEVVETYPQYAYINLSGAFLIDSFDTVVETMGVSEAKELEEYERLVLDGYGDRDADYVFSKYISEIKDDKELEKLDWAEVPDEEKLITLNKLRAEIRTRVNSIHDSKQKLVNKVGFNEIEYIFSFDNRVYEVGESFSEEIVSNSKQIFDYLEENKFVVKKLTWTSPFSIEVLFPRSVRMLFSPKRQLQLQFDALEILRGEVKNINRYKWIDLRSELIAVK